MMPHPVCSFGRVAKAPMPSVTQSHAKRPESFGDPVRPPYGNTPALRAATTASMRVCAPSFRIAERR